jgi:F-type H+-transporting ATPase subunit a
VSRRGCAVIGLVVLILFIVGLAGGAIGRGMNLPKISILEVPTLEIESFFRGEPVFLKDGPFPITNTLIASWITIVVATLFAFAATRKMKIIPGRLQGLVEMAMEGLINFIESVAGHKNGRRFLPMIATIFIFVMFNAYLALLPLYGPSIYVTDTQEAVAPADGTITWTLQAESVEGETEGEAEELKAESEGEIIALIELDENGEIAEVEAPKMGELEYHVEVGTHVYADDPIAAITTKPPLIRSASTDINMTLAMALLAVLFIELMGLTGRGFKHYISEYINVGELFRGIKLFFRGKIVDGLMAYVTGVINVIIGGLEFISHMTRMISFAFRLFGNMTAGEILVLSATFLIPWIMAVPFYGLELLIGFIQALIFGGLTLVFASIAVGHGSEEH